MADQKQGQGVTVDPKAAYLQLLGYGAYGQEQDPKARAAKIAEGVKTYRGQNQIPASASDDDVLREMKAEVASDPEAADRMKAIANGRDGKPTPYDVAVLQTGLAARGTPLAVNGELNAATLAAADSLKGSKPAAAPAAVRDPKVAEMQAYLRILGYNGTDNKANTGGVDGVRGRLTNGALRQFATDNKLPQNATPEQLLQALKERATSPAGLERMQAMMNSAQPHDQDARAVRTALRANGMDSRIGNEVAAITVLRSRLPSGTLSTTSNPDRVVMNSPTIAAAPPASTPREDRGPGEAGPATISTAPGVGRRVIDAYNASGNAAPAAPAAAATAEPAGSGLRIRPFTPPPVEPVLRDRSTVPVSESAPGQPGTVTDRGRTYTEAAPAAASAAPAPAVETMSERRLSAAAQPRVGQGPYLSGSAGTFNQNAGPAGGAYGRASEIARELEQGRVPEGVRANAFNINGRQTVFVQTSEGMGYRYSRSNDGSLMTASVFNLNNPNQMNQFNSQMDSASRQEANGARQADAQARREQAMRAAEDRQAAAHQRQAAGQLDQGLSQIRNGTSRDDVSGWVNVIQGAGGIFPRRP